MKIKNLFNKLFQKILLMRDIRDFKKSFLYYIFFRSIRIFLDGVFKIQIYDFFVFASSNKHKMSNSLLRKCDFDDVNELQILKKISRNKKIFFLDCGANYGFYSLYAASLSKNNKILSYEASPNTIEDLENNVKLNNFNNICYKNLAISDVAGKEVVFSESFNDWESSIVHYDYKNKKNLKVKTTTINFELENEDIKDYILVIKLDIEGNEFSAIQGGNKIIDKNNPLIIIELSKYNFNNKYFNFNFFKNFLEDKKYSVYNNKLIKVNFLDLVKNINNLNETKNKTIGNFFLIQDSSFMYKIFFDN
jgi:FkbM family methyltransferase